MSGLIGGALVLLGVVGALVGNVVWRRARRQVEWEAVDGTVCGARMLIDAQFDLARIEYKYSYRGRAFRNTTVRSPAVAVNWPGPAKRLIEKYPPGSAVTVFVNPKNPAQSVLECGGDPKFLPLVLIVSTVLLLLGLLFLVAPGKA
jgi:hypothetical protein